MAGYSLPLSCCPEWLRSPRTLCALLLDLQGFTLIHDRAQSSYLQPGLPPQLVGALLPSGAMNSTPLPSGSLPRPPGLNKPRPVVASPSPAGGVTPNPVNRRAPGPEPISGWRVVYVAVVLVLAFLLLFGSDPLKGIVNLESARQHARNEGATLAFEKEKTEHERKVMARERELWEKARDARLPQGAFWDVVWPAWECLAYGKREYWGVLRNIPEGWDAMDACMNMPVEIKGVELRRPNRCSHYFEFPERQVRGYWVVDWDQPDCKPWYRDFEDKVGPNPSSPPLPPRDCVYIPPDRDVRATDPENAKSKPRSWASTPRGSKTGGCYAKLHLWSGT